MENKSNLQILIIALIACCFGVLVYALDRQYDSLYYFPSCLSFSNQTDNYFGYLGYYLPTFIHVYVFILLTSIFLISNKNNFIAICLAWFAFDCLFEIGQHPFIAEKIAANIPVWFSSIPFLDNTANYFLLGTFDVVDILSICMGAIAAYVSLTIIRMRGT